MSPLTEPTRLTLAKGQPVPVDLNYSNVSLLLHGNGTNGSTTIVDNSPTPKTVTAVGNAQISTAVADPFGSSSLYFNNNSGNRLTTPSSSEFLFGTGDFTVEAWVYLLGQSSNSTLLEIGVSSSDGIFFSIGSANYAVYTGSTIGTRMLSALNEWVHIAYCRSSGTLKGFNNGSEVFSTSFTNNLSNISQISVGYAFGSGSGSSYNVNGYIDDLRITKGVARYTSNFTPPTAPFPDF